MDSSKYFFEDSLASPTASFESTEESRNRYSEVQLSPKLTGKALIGKIRQEIDAAVGQMQSNIQAAGQRGDNLDALQTKTGECS